MFCDCVTRWIENYPEGLWFLLSGRMCKFYSSIFGHWPIICWLGFVGRQRQANELLSLGNPHVMSYDCRKRRIGTSYGCKFCIYSKEVIFLYKIVGAPEKFGNLPRPFFRTISVYFYRFKKNLSDDPVPLSWIILICVKGSLPRDFRLIFSMHRFPLGPEYPTGAITNFYENSQDIFATLRLSRVSLTLVISCSLNDTGDKSSPVSLLPAINLSRVSTIPAVEQLKEYQSAYTMKWMFWNNSLQLNSFLNKIRKTFCFKNFLIYCRVRWHQW